MEEINVAVELLEFSKKCYTDKTLLKKIDETIGFFKSDRGRIHQEAIDILTAMKEAYDEGKTKMQLELVIKAMEAVK
jgi:hypothetical protein